MPFRVVNILVFFLFNSFATSLNRQTVTYFQNSSFTLKGELFLPSEKSTESLYPALLMVHEGGFTTQNRNCFDEHGAYYTKKGYAILSIDYRLVQQGGAYPNALKDALQALRWLKANAHHYKIDKKKIVLIGSSAGAYLVTMMSLAAGLPESIQKGHGLHLKEDLQVKGVVSSFGIYDWSQSEWPGGGFINKGQKESTSPVKYARFLKAPFLILAGERDMLFPVKQAQDFAQTLKSLDKQVQIEVMAKQSHGGICHLQGKIARWTLGYIDDFLDQTIHGK